MPAKQRASSRVWVDPDDPPEWTEEQFDRAEIAIGGEVVRSAQGTLTRPRGRPRKADAKVHTHIRLSPQARVFPRNRARVADAHRRGAPRMGREAPGCPAPGKAQTRRMIGAWTTLAHSVTSV